MREGKRGGRDKEREGEGDQGQERSGCVMGVPVTVHGGELAWGVLWWEHTEAL